jgi:hypothetical protein
MMNTQAPKKSNNSLLTQDQSYSIDNADFDSWAKEVKRQMIAALSKKGVLERP